MGSNYADSHHLCVSCENIDWDKDTASRECVTRNLTARAEAKARCSNCRTLIRNPLFRLCRQCAEHERLCQHCNRSTLTDEERSEIEAKAALLVAFDRAIDEYTLVVKAFGINSTNAARFRELQDKVTRRYLERLSLSDLDSRTHRPIWREVLGQNVLAAPFCNKCCHYHGYRTFDLASECGHLAIGHDMKWCVLCAVRKKLCSACGTSTDPSSEDQDE